MTGRHLRSAETVKFPCKKKFYTYYHLDWVLLRFFPIEVILILFYGYYRSIGLGREVTKNLILNFAENLTSSNVGGIFLFFFFFKSGKTFR